MDCAEFMAVGAGPTSQIQMRIPAYQSVEPGVRAKLLAPALGRSVIQLNHSVPGG